MTQPSGVVTAESINDTPNRWLWALLIAAFAALIFIFRDGLWLMTQWWESPEYSHGYMIPVISLFLLWQRLNDLPRALQRGSWLGVMLLLAGLVIYFVGELSALYTLIQYGFLISLLAITLAFFGVSGLRKLWVVFVYLIFMIPLPNFLYFNLSSQLQLISSKIGVAIIRLFDISVFLEGNVIDLGPMQLQVVEACSGLRYLFPLMSFGFLIAYLYRGAFWQRAIIFLSTIPITIFMNSLRIGLIGVTVDRWGIEMAQGLLHDFEGWAVFMGCVGILFGEIVIFSRFNKTSKSIAALVNLDLPKLNISLRDFHINSLSQRPFVLCAAILAIATPLLANVNERPETVPQRQAFAQFPQQLNNWKGRSVPLDRDVIDTLKFTDYMQADYHRDSDSMSVNFYVAWYGSQKKGASIHSPRSCIPGGGWRMQMLEQRALNISRRDGTPLRVNRALIQKGNVAEVVYYWFEGRNRDITNEYLAKWYIFWDALTQSRSDGALVRVVTYVPDASQTEAADKRLIEFLRDAYPQLNAYVP